MIITYGRIEDDEPSWVGTPDHGIGVLCNSATEMVTEVRRQTKHRHRQQRVHAVRRAARQGARDLRHLLWLTPMEAIVADRDRLGAEAPLAFSA